MRDLVDISSDTSSWCGCDDNSQQKIEQEEHQQWQEMQAEIESYIPLKADFEKFIMSQEKENVSL